MQCYTLCLVGYIKYASICALLSIKFFLFFLWYWKMLLQKNHLKLIFVILPRQLFLCKWKQFSENWMLYSNVQQGVSSQASSSWSDEITCISSRLNVIWFNDHGLNRSWNIEAKKIFGGREVHKALFMSYAVIGDDQCAYRVFHSIFLKFFYCKCWV